MKTIKNIPRYSVYKNSGVEWLGEIPINWKILRFNYVFCFGKGLNITKENLQDNGIPCVNYGEIHSKYGFEVDPQKHQLKYVSYEYLKENKKSLLNYGDFIFADTSEDIEGAGNFTYLNNAKDSIFAGYHTVITRPMINVNVRFLAYMFDSQSYRDQIRNKVKGVKVYSVTKSILKDTYISLPPDTEQNDIVTFLDKKIIPINQAIAIKQKQIALLKERQQIIIQKAVTQGLDPNVPMKDSGIEWIGRIPEHWKIIKLKYSTYINQNSLTESTSPNLEFEYVDIGNVTFDSGIIGKEKYTFRTSPSRARRIAKVGDTIVSTVRTYLKAIAAIDEQYQYCIYSTGFAVLSPQKELNNKYLTFFIKSDSFTNQVSSVAKGMSYPAINSSELSNLYICIPPYVEQKTIEKHIQKLTLKIEKLLSLYLEQIEKLKEYKATLIDSAVTGKIKITTEE